MTGWVVKLLKSPMLCLGQASSLRCWSFVALSNPQRFEALTTSSTMSALHAWRHRCVAAKWCTRVGRLVDIWGCVKTYEIHWNGRVPFGFDLIIPLWVLWLGWNSWWVVKYAICRLARRHQLPEMLRKVSRSETKVFPEGALQSDRPQSHKTRPKPMCFQWFSRWISILQLTCLIVFGLQPSFPVFFLEIHPYLEMGLFLFDTLISIGYKLQLSPITKRKNMPLNGYFGVLPS